jgi:hypothetical protein
MAEEKPGDARSSLGADFDTTAELWDRLVDDITGHGAPCLETVQRLVSDACQTAPLHLPDPDKAM